MATSPNVVELLLRVKQQGTEAIVRAKDALGKLGAAATAAAGEFAQTTKAEEATARAADKSASSHRRLAEGMGSISTSLSRLQSLYAGWIAAQAAFAGASRVIELADAYANLNARLKLATAGQREFATAQSGTYAIAQRLGAGLAETAALYGKLQAAVRSLGGTQQQALALTESIGQALRISGAGSADSAAALLQFGQALASGVLRGDEFNSVMENSPRLAQALADGLGVSTGRLRQMAEAGQLTASVVTKALQSQSQVLQAEFDQLPRTVGQSLTALQNAFMRWVGQMNEATGGTAKLAAALEFAAKHIDTLMTALGLLAAGALGKVALTLLPKLVTALQASGAAAILAGQKMAAGLALARTPLEFAIAGFGRLNVALAALGSAVAGYAIGTQLREQFSAVRVAGDYLGATLGAMDDAVRASQGLLGNLFSGNLGAGARQLALDVEGIRSAWLDTTAAARLAGQSMAQIGQTAGAPLEELQRRISAVRLSLGESTTNALQAMDEASGKLTATLQKLDAEANKAQAAVQSALGGMAAVREQQTAALDAALAERDAQMQRQAEALQASMQAADAALRERITQQNALLVQQTEERARLQEEATTKTLELLAKEDAARLQQAALDGRTLEERRAKALAVEAEILQGRLDTWKKAATAFQGHIDALIGEERRHVLAAAELEQARLGINQSIEQKIRELQRQTMGEAAALEDRKTEAVQLAAKARTAIAQGEFDKAREYAQQAQALYETVGRTRGQEGAAITGLKTAQDLLNQAILGEEKAHQQAASAAAQARTGMEQQLATAKAQIDDIAKALAGVQTLKVEADTSAAQTALAKLATLIPERDTLLTISANVSAAQQALQRLDTDVKAGREVVITADIEKGRKALDDLRTYADKTANVDLILSTDKARSAIDDVRERVQTLNTLKTESEHLIRSNAEQARRDIDSLNGRNTTSTHTVTVRQVEAHAAGGLVGRLSGAVRRLSSGGRVRGPGTETSDSIPALLSRGEFVVRAASVRQFGEGFFASLNAGLMPLSAGPVSRFAVGGLVGMDRPAPSASGAPIHLHFGDRQVGPLYAQQDVAEQLRQAALMFGAVA